MADKNNEWNENLNIICMGYNTSVHESTKLTPFELTFGHKVNLPSAIATTSSSTKNELINLWKIRHVKYINQAKENLK